MFFFLLFFLLPSFRAIPIEKILEDQAYADSSIRIVSELPLQEKRKLLYAHYPSLHENLLLLSIKDKKLSNAECSLLQLTAEHYPSTELSLEQAEWLLSLLSVPDYSVFFQETIPLDSISQIAISEDMFAIAELKVFKDSHNKVPILMYHQVHSTNFWITPETFKKHLEKMYRSGYCLINLSDFLKGDFSSIPDGRKPILITFDDAFESQFTMQPNGMPTSNCAIGIMEAFTAEHPDFNCTATFFPYLSIIPFGQVRQEKLWIKKFRYLWDNGYDIGCHSYYHTFFGNISQKAIKEELDFFYNHLSYYFPEDFIRSFTVAYPYGSLPKEMKLITEYEYKGNRLLGGCSAWGGLSPLVHHGNRFLLPRIQADANTLDDMDTWVSYSVESKTYSLPKFYQNCPELVNLWVRKNDPSSLGQYFYQTKLLN